MVPVTTGEEESGRLAPTGWDAGPEAPAPRGRGLQPRSECFARSAMPGPVKQVALAPNLQMGNLSLGSSRFLSS
jgi:hypothetical protein